MEKEILNEWWTQVQQGDTNAFCKVYFHTINMVGNQAYRIIRDRETAKDIVQETYETLYKNRHSIHAGNIAGYLHTTVKHKSLNALKGLLLNREYSYEHIESIELTEEPADHREAEMMMGEVESVIAELSEKCRDVFILKYYNQFSYKQIAQQLGISVKTVEKHLARAILVLKQRLNKQQLSILLLLILLH